MKRNLFQSFFILFLVAFSLNASAVERSSKSSIDRLITYTNFGTGDIFVTLKTNGEVCTYGYFVNQDSPGYEGTLSNLLAAFATKNEIHIYANPAKRWTGSQHPVCEIYAVEQLN